MKNNRIEIPEMITMATEDGGRHTLYVDDTLRTVKNMAAEYFNLESNVTIEDLSDRYLLELFIDFIKELYEDLDNLYSYVDVDPCEVSEIYFLHEALVALADGLLEDVNFDEAEDEVEIVSLEEAFEFLLDNGYGEDDTFIDESLLETEIKVHKFITNIIDNVDAIKTVGRRFGIDIYQIEEDLLTDSEFVDILMDAMRSLMSDLYNYNECEELEDIEDAVSEVYIGLVTLKSLLNHLAALRHSNI